MRLSVIKLTNTQWMVYADGDLNKVVSIHRSKAAADAAAKRGKTSTDEAFEREVDRSQRMLEHLFGFNEEDLK